MRRLRRFGILAALLAAALAAGCPKAKTGPAEAPPANAVSLKYQFPKGRILKYHTKSETHMSFTIPFLPEPQQVKNVTDMNTVEEVLQEPLQGFALIEQRIEGYRFILYQANKVIFDSARPDDYPNQPQFEGLLRLRGMKIRYQMSVSGEIRATEGFDSLGEAIGPVNISQVFQSAQPTFPTKPISPGESWQSSREIALSPSKGVSGAITISDKAKLVEVRREGNSQRAVIELVRNVSIDLESLTTPNKRNSKALIKGKGELVSTIIFDIERGVIIQSDGRLKISTATAALKQPNLNQLSIDIEGIIGNTLIEQ